MCSCSCCAAALVTCLICCDQSTPCPLDMQGAAAGTQEAIWLEFTLLQHLAYCYTTTAVSLHISLSFCVTLSASLAAHQAAPSGGGKL